MMNGSWLQDHISNRSPVQRATLTCGSRWKWWMRVKRETVGEHLAPRRPAPRRRRHSRKCSRTARSSPVRRRSLSLRRPRFRRRRAVHRTAPAHRAASASLRGHQRRAALRNPPRSLRQRGMRSARPRDDCRNRVADIADAIGGDHRLVAQPDTVERIRQVGRCPARSGSPPRLGSRRAADVSMPRMRA